MLKHIILPPYLQQGIRSMSNGFPEKLRIIVADTETVNGEPYSIQLFDGETAIYSLHKNEDILLTFLKFVTKRMVKGYSNYVYFHGLDFDLPVLLHAYHDLFVQNEFQLDFPQHEIFLECFTGKMTFAKMHTPEGVVYIYDSFRFVLCSLAKACEDMRLPRKKLPRPSYLGSRAPTPEEARSFREYAMADVYALWELVQWIMDRVRELDTKVPISIAQLASFVFRKNFMPKGERINFPSIPCAIDSILSYHGGKNGLYTKAPTLLRGVSGYDINSAYPWAMKMLPSFIGGQYKQVRKFSDKYVGIYIVSGNYHYEKYHLFYHHNFDVHDSGKVENLCVTSFELERALALGWFKPSSIRGWVFLPDHTTGSPLGAYVDYFYTQKQTLNKTNSRYWIVKTLLNSLYGKFIQSTDFNTTERIVTAVKNGTFQVQHLERQAVAGGLFQPFLASLITGAVRAKLFDYERAHNALHSSTDAILTRDTFGSSTELGGLKFENKGDCLLLRNKLYLHTDGTRFEDTALAGYDEKDKETQSKLWGKYALHGYQGDISTLLHLWKDRKNTYHISRMTKLKESFKQKGVGYKPLMWHDYEKSLEVDWAQYTEEE